MRRALVCLLLAVAACGDTGGGAPERVCQQYPIPWPAAPGAKAAATAELAAVAPGATMTWRESTGTFASILNLDIPLPGCTDGQDVNAQVLALVAAHPALFQMDLTEWRTPPSLDCRLISEELETLDMSRMLTAGQPVNQDLFAYSVKRVDGFVTLTSVNGTYVGIASELLADAMTTCGSLTAAQAEATARATPLPARVYSQCAPQGDLTYHPRAGDTFVLGPESWLWDEGTGEVLLNGQRTLRVTVNPANYTADLLNSAARCPVTDPDSEGFTVGFDLTFDVQTGEIQYIKAGLDCVVC